MCLDDWRGPWTISAIGIGDFTGQTALKGNNEKMFKVDGGMDVKVTFKDASGNEKQIPIYYKMNLNDPQGSSMLSMLKEAFSHKLPVQVMDHYTTHNCDDFDQLIVYRD